MRPLVAADALAPVRRVTDEDRPSFYEADRFAAGAYAVFVGDSAHANNGRNFLGVVTEHEIARQPTRIFADLLPRPGVRAVGAATSLEEVRSRLDTACVGAIPVVDDAGRFVGAVTRESLSEALLKGARLARAPHEPERAALVARVERLQALHDAALKLLNLFARHGIETELLREAIDLYTTLIEARYGAIGVLDEEGNLAQFVYTGVSPDEAARIGRLPEGKGLLGVVISENQVLRLDDLSKHPRAAGFPPHHPPMQSLLAVPISHDGKAYGRVYLSEKVNGGPFSDEDERLARHLADVLALTLAYHRYRTERNRAERALREREARLRALVDAVPDLLFRIREDGTYLDYKAARDFPAYVPPEQFLGRKVMDVLPRDVAQESMRLIRRAIETQEVQTQNYRLMLGDEPRDYEARIAPCGRDEVLGMVRDVTERNRADQLIRQLASALEQTADAVLITNRDGVIEYVNPAFERITGFNRAEAVGSKPSIVRSGRHDRSFYEQMWQTILGGEVFRGVLVNRRNNGSLYYEEKTITPLRNARGEITHFISTGKDITERRQQEEVIARLGRTLDQSSNEIYVFDAETLRFTQLNHGARRNLGYGMDELSRMTPLDLMPDLSRDQFEALLAPLKRGETDLAAFETTHRRKDGSTYPVEVRMHLSRAEEFPLVVAIVQDVTERKEAEARLNYLAYYDTLTGLPNRVLLHDRLTQAITEADRYQRLVAVVFLDLDHFKLVNDTLGHDLGDALLRAVAERLTGSVRSGDTVARLSGDEFTVILANVAQIDDIARVARKILDRFTPPFVVGGRELYVTSSMGIAIYPSDDSDVENLLKHADAAMYHAKERGRNAFQFYTAEINERAQRRMLLETALRHALANRELLLHYQPQLDLRTGRITGVEALLRWHHPDFGPVPPADFIPLAEEIGLIVPIGAWVLTTACAQARAWHDAGFGDLRLAVNLSTRQFQEGDLLETVRQTLAQTGLAARCLDLELTETMLMREMEGNIDTMRKLNEIGVAFSLDDFGTGYSSLAYLGRFPLDTLKIDRAFVKDITTDPGDAAITQAIIAMAHSLGMKAIAEGVETQEQCEFLSRHGCDAAQGYYVSTPLPADEMGNFLHGYRRPASSNGRAKRSRSAHEGRRGRR